MTTMQVKKSHLCDFFYDVKIKCLRFVLVWAYTVNMNWDEIYDNMVFAPNKDQYATYQKSKDMWAALVGYQEGTHRACELDDHLGYLERQYGDRVKVPVRQMRQSFKIDDEQVRMGMYQDALQTIKRRLRL